MRTIVLKALVDRLLLNVDGSDTALYVAYSSCFFRKRMLFDFLSTFALVFVVRILSKRLQSGLQIHVLRKREIGVSCLLIRLINLDAISGGKEFHHVRVSRVDEHNKQYGNHNERPHRWSCERRLLEREEPSQRQFGNEERGQHKLDKGKPKLSSGIKGNWVVVDKLVPVSGFEQNKAEKECARGLHRKRG